MRPAIRFALSFIGIVVTAVMASVDAQQPAAAPPAAPPAEQAPTFRGGTTLIPLDVRVLDSRGRPVTDLTAEDFTITEDGVRQALRHFSTQPLTPVPDEQVERGPLLLQTAKPSAIAPSNRRTFLIMLGRGDLEGPSAGVDGAIHLVRDRLLPQDYVSIMAWNRSTTFTTDHAGALAVLTRFKAGFRKVERQLYDYLRSPVYFYGDRTVMPAYIQRGIDQIFGGASSAPMRTNNAQLTGSSTLDRAANEIYDAYNAPAQDRGAALVRDQMGMSIEDFFSDLGATVDDSNNIYAGIEYMRHLDGEKHLVWFTDIGFRMMGVIVAAEFERDIARTAADGRVVLDIIRSGGVEFSSSMAASSRGAPPVGPRIGHPVPLMGGSSIWPAAASRTMAEITGGRSDANRFPNASVAIDYIDQASRFQYLLGYSPINERWDGSFRRVRVTVNRPGLTVLVRGGYYARKTELGLIDRRGVVTHSRVSAAAREPREIHDLDLRGTATRTGTEATRSVTVDVTVDLSRVTFQLVAGRQHAEIEIQAFILDKRQHPVGDLRQVIVLDYTPERLAVVKTTGAQATLVVPVTGDADSVKLVAYHFPDDLTGSVNLTIAP